MLWTHLSVIVIHIGPFISSVPFATLDDINYYSDIEKDILFSMHTIFRIDQVNELEDGMWQINLTLTADNDQQLMDLSACIRNEIGDDQPGWVRMADLMIKMGRFDKAVEIYNTLLEGMITDHQEAVVTSLSTVLNNSAVVYATLGNYSTALEYCRKTFEIMRKNDSHVIIHSWLDSIIILAKYTDYQMNFSLTFCAMRKLLI